MAGPTRGWCTLLCCALCAGLAACGSSTPPPAEPAGRDCPSAEQYQELVVEFFLKGLADQPGERPQLTLEAERTLRLMARNGHARLSGSADCERAIDALQTVRSQAARAIETGNVVDASSPAELCPLWPLCD